MNADLLGTRDAAIAPQGAIGDATLYVGIFAAFGALAYALPLYSFLQGMLRDELLLAVVNRDFVNYWMAGKLVLAGGQLDLFSQGVYFARLQDMFGPDYPIHNWSYPPHFLLLLWPFGYLDYKVGLVVFLAVTFVLFVASVLLFRKVYASKSGLAVLILAIAAYSLMMIDTAQNGFLTGALLLLGFAWMKQRPVLAGIAFAFLTIKPQLGVLIPILLLMDRNWKAVFWATAWTVLLVILSAAAYGVDSWKAYFLETLPYQSFVMTDWYGIFLRMMPTTFASMRTLDFTPETAYLFQWSVSACALALVVWALSREADHLRRIFIVACGTFLVSPYAFNYDMGALTAIAAILVGSQWSRNRPALIAVCVTAGLSAAVMNLGRVGLPIAPILLAMGLVSVVFGTWGVTRGGDAVPGTLVPAAQDSEAVSFRDAKA